VDCGYNFVGRFYCCCVGAGDFMEVRGVNTNGEEAAFYFEEAVVRIWVNVVSGIWVNVVSGILFSIYPWWQRGGGGVYVFDICV
jgi:hypothetical protein